MNRCKMCKQPTKNKVFCSIRCNGKWATTTPEGRAKFYTAARGKKISAAKVQMHKDRPELAERLRQRQLVNNCMKNPATRKLVSRLHKASGMKPSVRGGNGTGPTAAEKLLLDMFHPHAKNNYAVTTGQKAGSGYPTHYKVDVAFPEFKIAVEADGSSHRMAGRPEQDVKKTNCLTTLGWTVLRFTNQRIMEDTQNVKEEIRSVIMRFQP